MRDVLRYIGIMDGDDLILKLVSQIHLLFHPDMKDIEFLRRRMTG